MALLPESNHFMKNVYQIVSKQCSLEPNFPFLLFQMPQKPFSINYQKVCLPFNRFTNPSIFNKKTYFSLWGQSHVSALSRELSNKELNTNKILLKNPYKNQELIRKSTDLGVNMMFVDSFEELYKIHQKSCIYRENTQVNSPTQYIWGVSDAETDLKQIKTLSQYNIGIDGLYFTKIDTSNYFTVKDITVRLLKESEQRKKIKKVFVEIQSGSFSILKEKLTKDQIFVKNKLSDYSLTDNYLIASRILGKNKIGQNVFTDDSNYYFDQKGQRQGRVFYENDRKWLLSKIDRFPCFEVFQQHEQKYLRKVY